MLLKFTNATPQISKLILNRSYESKFRLPYGILFEGEFDAFHHKLIKLLDEVNPIMNITVGDYVTSSFIKKEVPIKIAIVDFKIERKPFQYDPTPFFKRKFVISNPPGSINASSWLTIQYALSLEESSLIIVEGEEDLLALPCVLGAPLNSAIFFGIPNVGLMFVLVDSNAKNYALNLLKCFVPEYSQ